MDQNILVRRGPTTSEVTYYFMGLNNKANQKIGLGLLRMEPFNKAFLLNKYGEFFSN